MKKVLLWSATVLALFAGCENSEKDKFLHGLQLDEVTIAPIDSIELEQFDIFQPGKLVKEDNWFAISSNRAEWNVTLVNPQSGDSFGVLRRGRGPGEVAAGVCFQKSQAGVIYYDRVSYKCLGFDLKRTIAERVASIDTLGNFLGKTPNPSRLCRCEDGFVSGNSTNSEVWYSLYSEDGTILSEVPAFHFDETDNANQDFLSSMLTSSIYASNYDGTKICVASVAAGALAFASVSDGILSEYERYEIEAPLTDKHGDFTVFSSNAITFFSRY